MTVDLKPKVLNPNGGIMTVNLYKIDESYYFFEQSNEKTKDLPIYTDETVSRWLIPRGEALVIQRPSRTL
jgi:hypothetical protein